MDTTDDVKNDSGASAANNAVVAKPVPFFITPSL